MIPDAFRPSSAFERLGFKDAVPNALARTQGLMRLTRAALDGEPAPVGPTPCHLVDEAGAARLLRYEGARAPTYRVPVLLVPSVINRHYILDLSDGISVVQHLLSAGHAVYIVDWGNPGDAELGLDFADFVLGRLRAFVDTVREDAGSDEVHLVGHCLGGTMATSLAAVDPEGICTLTNLTAPLDFHDDGMLSAWSRAPFFDAKAFADVIGHIPPWLTQPSFQMLRPMGTPVKMMRLFQNLGNERFLEFYRALETWVNDNVAIPQGFYVDLITKLYRDNAIMNGRFQIGPDPVVLEEITVPTLTVCAKKDHIVPPASATRGHEKIGAADKRLELFEGGHIGVVVGGNARRQLWPLLEEWFGGHDAGRAHAEALDLNDVPLTDDERALDGIAREESYG